MCNSEDNENNKHHKRIRNTKVFVCQLCGRSFVSRDGAFANHLRLKHSITSKEYYDKYLKKPGEGICPVCGKETSFANISPGYAKYCSLKCMANSPEVNAKKKATTKKHYGVENPFQSEELKEKSRETMIEKYGVDNSQRSPKLRAKTAQTNMQRYGAENPFGSKEIQEKIAATNLEKYGVENPSYSPEIIRKIKVVKNEKLLERIENGEQINFYSLEKFAFLNWDLRNIY